MQEKEQETDNEKTVNVIAEDCVADKRPWKRRALGKSNTSPILVLLARCFIFLQTNSFRS